MTVIERALWLPDEPDAVLLPQIDEFSPGDLVVRYRSLQDRDFRKDIRKALWRSERGAYALPFGPGGLMIPITQREWPQFIGAVAPTNVAVTPTTLGTTVGRVFPFVLDRGISMGKVHIHTVNAVATSFQFGVFSFNGQTKKYDSGTQGTSANWTILSPTAVKIASGLTNYAVITNANLTSATTAYYFTAAFVSASLPRWGTVVATAGAMPASFTPGSGITATVGGWPIVILSSV